MKLAKTKRLYQKFCHSMRISGWLHTGRRTLGYLTRHATQHSAAPAAPILKHGANLKEIYGHFAKIAFDAFLNSAASFTFPPVEQPKISVIIVLYNRAELTLDCLKSLLAAARTPCEVILVDNASTDQTPQLLSSLDGVRVIRNQDNKGFACAVNQAAAVARGDYLLLLNNDTQVLGDSLAAAADYLHANADVGAVGGRILLLDGSLQEAGSAVFRDGSTAGVGRGGNPYDPAYMFRRDVDYCSGAFLMTPRSLFLELGGFKEDFFPAYYEDVDYCARLWQAGRRVTYLPDVALLHYEYGSSPSSAASIKLMARKKEAFLRLHHAWLERQYPPSPAGRWQSLRARDCRKRILYIDDRLPHPWLGSGFPRSNRILRQLLQFGYNVTFYPMQPLAESWNEVYRSLPKEIEAVIGRGSAGLAAFLAQRPDFYDLAFVSRPHNMRVLCSLLAVDPHLLGRAKIIYDAEALFALREVKQREVTERRTTAQDELQRRIADEVQLAACAQAVISVSAREAEHFQQRNISQVYVLGHALETCPQTQPFEGRSGLLFVGPVLDPAAPNADSVRWLLAEVMPRLRRRMGMNVEIAFAGAWNENLLPAAENLSAVRLLGRVDDLKPVYERARIFVAPTRYAAGIPHKVHEAAAAGLPAVVSSLLAEQLNWRPGEEVLAADDPEEFAELCYRLHEDPHLWQRLRDGALQAVLRDCAPENFNRTLQLILQQTLQRSEKYEDIAPPHFPIYSRAPNSKTSA